MHETDTRKDRDPQGRHYPPAKGSTTEAYLRQDQEAGKGPRDGNRWKGGVPPSDRS